MRNYGALSFTGTTEEGSFEEQILSGRKTQTIRYPRKDDRPHVKVGYTTKLYWKMRTKDNRLIGYAEILAYEETCLLDMWFDEENAKADGFKDLDEFREWFYPDWFGLPGIIRDAVQAAASIGKDTAETVINVTASRRFGKSTTMKTVEYLIKPVYRIKWKYPLHPICVSCGNPLQYSNNYTKYCAECIDKARE